jgi:hypothetical protein
MGKFRDNYECKNWRQDLDFCGKYYVSGEI